MAMQGSIAPNFHEGSRSEYLAQYFFSALGTSIMVPRQEDSGIDLHCTLGTKIGRRFHVDNYFLVQVKSTTAKIVYKGESIGWLLSHKYPLIICIVSKKKNQISLFQTMELMKFYQSTQLKSISLYFSINTRPFDFASSIGEGEISASLGPPILQVSLAELSSAIKIAEYRFLLKRWLECMQLNIDAREMGLSLFRHPAEYYQTNIVPSEIFALAGSTSRIRENQNQKKMSQNILWFLLAQYIYIISEDASLEQFVRLYNSIGSLLATASEIPNDSLLTNKGLNLLCGMVNGNAERFGLDGRIKIAGELQTSISTPTLKMERKDSMTGS